MKCVICGEKIDRSLAAKIKKLGAPERCCACVAKQRQKEELLMVDSRRARLVEFTPQSACVFLERSQLREAYAK